MQSLMNCNKKVHLFPSHICYTHNSYFIKSSFIHINRVLLFSSIACHKNDDKQTRVLLPVCLLLDFSPRLRLLLMSNDRDDREKNDNDDKTLCAALLTINSCCWNLLDYFLSPVYLSLCQYFLLFFFIDEKALLHTLVQTYI